MIVDSEEFDLCCAFVEGLVAMPDLWVVAWPSRGRRTALGADPHRRQVQQQEAGWRAAYECLIEAVRESIPPPET
jgi:hypothetical protein